MDSTSVARSTNGHHGHTFGILVRRYRRARGLTQEDLARKAGVSVRSIGNMERHEGHIPHPDTVHLLVKTLGLGPDEHDMLLSAVHRLRSTPQLMPSGVAEPPIVGRSKEVGLLKRHLSGQGPPVLLFAGEPGIGKSCLLRYAASQSIAYGLCALQGGCQRRDGQKPYAPLLMAINGYLRRQSLEQQRKDLEGCAWLVKLLPELADGPIKPIPSSGLPPDQENRLMIDALQSFLTNVGRSGNGHAGGGTLLLLDDLQWAGPDALDLIIAIAHAAIDIQLRIVGAYRDNELDWKTPLAEALADLAHRGLTAHHVLEPLSTEEAGLLLDELLGHDPGYDRSNTSWRENIVQKTGGVPFFLVSYALAMQQGAANETASRGTIAIPWDVRQTVQQRVAALPLSTQNVIGVAALIGRQVDVDLLSVVCHQQTWDVIASLEAAHHAHILDEEQPVYRFAHDVIREVLETSIGVARRTELHRVIANALENQQGRKPAIERLAYHYAQGQIHDKAALYLERAGDQAFSSYAHTAAARYYEDALEHLMLLKDTLATARVLVKQGTMLRLLGQHDGALYALEKAVRIYIDLNDLESAARAMAETWLLHAERGTASEGVQRFQTIIDLCEAQEQATPGLAVLYGFQANLLNIVGTYDALMRTATRAIELAHTVEDPQILAEAEYKRGMILQNMVGRVEEAAQAYRQAIRIGEEAGGAANLAGWYRALADIYFARGELAQSRHALTRSYEVAKEQGNVLRMAWAIEIQGILAQCAGDWIQAETHLRQALSEGRRLQSARGLLSALLSMANLCLQRGDWNTALLHLDEAETIVRQTFNSEPSRRATCLRAHYDLQQGNPAAAYERLIALLDRPGIQETSVNGILICLAWAESEVGRLEQAAQTIAQAIGRLRTDSCRLELIDALRIHAIIATRTNMRSEAENALKEGLSLARSIPYRYGEARILSSYGTLFAQHGKVKAARRKITDARSIFQDLGAIWDLQQTEHSLAQLS